jgi:hypothetical protein
MQETSTDGEAMTPPLSACSGLTLTRTDDAAAIDALRSDADMWRRLTLAALDAAARLQQQLDLQERINISLREELLCRMRVPVDVVAVLSEGDA